MEFATAPNTGVELACCPKTGVALGLAPKAGGWEAPAEKGKGVGEPKAEPNEGDWLAPNPPEEAELKTNGEGAADGAEVDKREVSNVG